VDNETALQTFSKKLADRFGKIPQQAFELLEVVRLRWVAIELGIEKIILKENKMICYFIADQQSAFYSSDFFMKIVQSIQKNVVSCNMKELNNKLTIIFTHVEYIGTARSLLEKLRDSVN
jgi:transcription-repair coupling factor (superfamily II helicase)